MTVLRSGSASDVGRIRAVNEDLAFDASPLYGVADGMGGHVGGDVAARIAVETFEEGFSTDPTVDGMIAAVQKANIAVWERGRVDPDLRGMGTTITAIALISDPSADGGDRLVLVNVGDSRGYRLRDGELQQVTIDHSVAEELVARGELTPEEASLHPHRHILTRALGVAPEVEVDAWELFARTGDRYLLCSDGLSNEVAAHLITEILGKGLSPVLAAEELIRAANEHGGNDNITVVVVDVVESDASRDGTDAASVASLSTGGGEHHSSPVPITPSAAQLSGAQKGVGTLALERPLTLEPDRISTSEPDLGPQASDRSGAFTLGRADLDRQARIATKNPRLVTFRLVFFLLIVAVVVGGAWGIIRWYLDNSFFLGVDGKQIVVEQGRPGGFLWFNPLVVDRTGVTTSDVPANQVTGVQNGSFTASSRAAALGTLRHMVLAQCNYESGVPGVTPTTLAPSKVPAIARCPVTPSAKVSPPPSTTTSTTSTSTPSGTGSTTTSTTTETG